MDVVVYRRELRTRHGIKMLHDMAATQNAPRDQPSTATKPKPKAIEAVCVGERPLGEACLDESLQQLQAW